MIYQIIYSPESEYHLRALTVRQQRLVLDEVDKNLKYEPTAETKNRKRLRHNPLATWELRIDNLRVFYEVENEVVYVVYIKAVGIKERNRLWIGDEEIEL